MPDLLAALDAFLQELRAGQWNLAVLILSTLVAACATANTAAQDRTYAAIEACKELQPSGYQVTRVYADGHLHYKAGSWSGGRDAWLACIRAGGPR